jgi:DNA-binding transcriptional LysR family regulator
MGGDTERTMRENISEILDFLAVARERSFTRAAAKLGVSQSALSHSVRALEARLGVRLLTRTTRSVSATEAGERLVHSVAPRLAEIEAEMAAVSELGEKVAGTIRITAIDHVVDSLVWPRLGPVLHQYPELRVEISTDYRMVDIAAEGYDIGIRWGDQVQQDMVAVRLTPDQPMSIVAAPTYLAAHGVPASPQDLLRHNCITLRLVSSGGLYAWELQQGKRRVEVRVGGQATFTSAYPMLHAALSGHGLALLPENMVQLHVDAGRLQKAMTDWCPVFPGLHAYYTSRRHSARALKIVVDALRGAFQAAGQPARPGGICRRGTSCSTACSGGGQRVARRQADALAGGRMEGILQGRCHRRQQCFAHAVGRQRRGASGKVGAFHAWRFRMAHLGAAVLALPRAA